MATRKVDGVLPEARITEEDLAELRRRIGMKLRVDSTIGNDLASRASIRAFARGIGDMNPLWQDEEYAKKTRYGTLVVPPGWMYSVCGSGPQHGLPGVHALFLRHSWEFYLPILLGDSVKPECTALGFEEKKARFAGRMIIQNQEIKYYNQRGELVVRAEHQIGRMERVAGRETKKEESLHLQLPHPWTEEELKKLEEEILSEQIRGSEVRYWEDVEIGEEVSPVIKGPLGLTDEMMWMKGAGGGGTALELSVHRYRRHPNWYYRCPETHALEPMGAVHYNTIAAKASGLPYPYDIGQQRSSWTMHSWTNWMGDEGWLKKCYTKYLRPNYFSDVLWIRGKVTRRHIDENGEYCVDVETSGINQRGENTLEAEATIILPSREAGTWPVEKRLPHK